MPYLSKLLIDAVNNINQVTSLAELENVRAKYLGKKSFLSLQINNLGLLPYKRRRVLGKIINKIKEKIKQTLNIQKIKLKNKDINKRLLEEKIDISLPGRHTENGSLHPVTLTIDRIENFFIRLGFNIVSGPEIEDNYHNFDALNIPIYHPVRDDHDTFWFDANRLLRTQTSGIQIRIMNKHNLPIRIITSGRVYRNDHDQTHTPMFHQLEGLIVDKHISFSNLKGILCNFLNYFFEQSLTIRFRPSYFPFTEPSAEVDIMDKNGKWLEVLGCGMIHPNVLNNANLDSEIYSGFAYGVGIERLTMLRYNISDLRTFFENDLRFLKQFK